MFKGGMRYDRKKTKKMILISIGCLLCAAGWNRHPFW